jgi:hypothetical protein
LNTLRFFILFFLFTTIGCRHQQHDVLVSAEVDMEKDNHSQSIDHGNKATNGALLLTRFTSLEEFKTVVQIQYFGGESDSKPTDGSKPYVCLTYQAGGHKITSILKSGISQGDFWAARNGTLWDKVMLGLKCPFAFFHRKDLGIIENLGRRRPWRFGKGDVAFYDLAETTVNHIVQDDRITMPPEDLSEKGYLNTFNHVTAQAFMTSVFTDEIADFVADVHELYNMPELITGKFSGTQLADFEDGPVDNYIDMLNNEWGQELGKVLRSKYSISAKTVWTPELLADYLNDIQRYYSWVFQIGFEPFRPTDEIVERFAGKMNGLMGAAEPSSE